MDGMDKPSLFTFHKRDVMGMDTPPFLFFPKWCTILLEIQQLNLTRKKSTSIMRGNMWGVLSKINSFSFFKIDVRFPSNYLVIFLICTDSILFLCNIDDI